jgi:hypothetical protein
MRQAKKYHFSTFECWSCLWAADEKGRLYGVAVLTSDYDDPQKMEHDLIIKMQKEYGLATVY